MSDFNALKFVADNAGLNIFKALEKAYEQGKADAAPRWIPVTPETMPPDDEEVEVTILDDSGDSPFRYTTVGWHYNGLWIANNERCFEVVAWKPLSEPWEGE